MPESRHALASFGGSPLFVSLTLFLVLTSSWLFVQCSPTITCGKGTILQGNQCVAISDGGPNDGGVHKDTIPKETEPRESLVKETLPTDVKVVDWSQKRRTIGAVKSFQLKGQLKLFREQGWLTSLVDVCPTDKKHFDPGLCTYDYLWFDNKGQPLHTIPNTRQGIFSQDMRHLAFYQKLKLHCNRHPSDPSYQFFVGEVVVVDTLTGKQPLWTFNGVFEVFNFGFTNLGRYLLFSHTAKAEKRSGQDFCHYTSSPEKILLRTSTWKRHSIKGAKPSSKLLGYRFDLSSTTGVFDTYEYQANKKKTYRYYSLKDDGTTKLLLTKKDAWDSRLSHVDDSWLYVEYRKGDDLSNSTRHILLYDHKTGETKDSFQHPKEFDSLRGNFLEGWIRYCKKKKDLKGELWYCSFYNLLGKYPPYKDLFIGSSLSPHFWDGKRQTFYYIDPEKERLESLDLTTGKAKTIIPNIKDGRFRSSNGYVMFTDGSRIFILAPRFIELPIKHYSSAEFITNRPKDASPILMIATKDTGFSNLRGLYLLHLEKMQLTKLSSRAFYGKLSSPPCNRPRSTTWVNSQKAKFLYFSEVDEKDPTKLQVFLVSMEPSSPPIKLFTVDSDRCESPAVSPSGKSIAWPLYEGEKKAGAKLSGKLFVSQWTP